ncbi:MAG: DUF4982 domain-containing protein [Bacteroidales bacterium]|nr:DUF4982 domain-containing protein [Bacteroidales bacterium]
MKRLAIMLLCASIPFTALSQPQLSSERGFNDGWTFWSEKDAKSEVVDLPHDAMLHEQRDPELPDGEASAYFPGGFYHYEKVLDVPKSWLKRHVSLNFGGVYRRAKVFVNGEEAGSCDNGFIPFQICLDGFLRSGENTIRVDVDNSSMPNCRWYSGAGIYRDVNLSVQEKDHIEDVRISTVSIHPAKVLVRTRHTGGKVKVRICHDGRTVASAKGDSLEISVPDAELWTAETPSLYTAEVTLKKGWKKLERQEVEFGIRQITYGPDGLKINGKDLLLKGGAIHSDNGILGACEYDDAAFRRISILKSYGFNAIRSAHNTASESVLKACDRLGMYVMDELFDGWFLPKNEHDYSEDFMENYRSDAAAVVEKDFNHPSVLMYSIGNEISEPVLPGGMEVAHTLIDELNRLDPWRIVTGGINITILSGTAKGSGLYYKDESAPKNETAEKYQALNLKAMSSQEFNELMLKLNNLVYSQVLTEFADSVSTPIMDALDIAGYNYGNLRYPIEGEKHPGRVIVGSETFPQDVVKNWRDSQRLPYLVGDFLWSAWDYIGEAGVGAWAYGGGEVALSKPYPWLLADVGVLDILGNPTGEALLVKALWNEGTMDPLIAVRPVREDVPVKSAWRGTNSIPSWGWRGQDGITATVEVYSNAPSVELFLSGRSLGRKTVEDYVAVWEVPYESGTLEAVAFYPEGERRSTLSSAVGHLKIDAEIEPHGKLVYLPVSLVGENGSLESNSDIPVSIEVSGGRLLGFGSARPFSEESFLGNTATTYYGKAQAVVERGNGPLSVKISAPGLESLILESN